MRYEEILELVKAVSNAGLSNFEYTEGNIRIVMSCPENAQGTAASAAIVQTDGQQAAVLQAAPAPASAPAASDKAPAEPSGNIVKSPLVGTFYAAPSEEAPAFVKVGDTVKKGQTLAIVEAMKLMNEIESEFDGVVKEVYVQNEETVEFGQPLFCIG